MSPRAQSNNIHQKLEQLQDLNLVVQRSKSQAVINAIQKSSLRLPESGNYFVELRGRTMHIFEIHKGISHYNFEDKQEPVSFHLEADKINIHVHGGTIDRIVLHTEPHTPTADVASIEELSAPLDLLDEFANLQAKKRLNAADLQRKRELIKEISKEFRKLDSEPISTRRGRSSPSYSSGGESRFGSGRSAG